MTGFPRPGELYGGRYEVQRELGHGDVGTVYEAHDKVLDRDVALKVVLPSTANRADVQRRFAREAAALARIQSPHVVGIHEYGEHEDTAYVVTQLCPDGDLRRWLAAHGPLDRRQGVALVAAVCEALVDAHDARVIHGDVSPANVLLHARADGLVPYLGDFGIVPAAGQDLAPSGALSGSPAWMAPERHFGRPADEAGDVYGTGCLLWTVLTGRAPYAGTDFAMTNAHINDPVPQLGTLDRVDLRIDALLAAALAKDPARRPSAEEVRRGLLDLLDLLAELDGPDPAEPAEADQAPPRPVLLAAALVLVGLVVVVGAAALLLG